MTAEILFGNDAVLLHTTFIEFPQAQLYSNKSTDAPEWYAKKFYFTKVDYFELKPQHVCQKMNIKLKRKSIKITGIFLLL